MIRSLGQSVNILEALQEVLETGCGGGAGEGDGGIGAPPSFLSADYSALIRDAPRLNDQFKRRKQVLRALCGVILDLSVDLGKLRGNKEAAKRRLPELQNILASRPFDAVLSFFTS